jgi:hypothetical protein
VCGPSIGADGGRVDRWGARGGYILQACLRWRGDTRFTFGLAKLDATPPAPISASMSHPHITPSEREECLLRLSRSARPNADNAPGHTPRATASCGWSVRDAGTSCDSHVQHSPPRTPCPRSLQMSAGALHRAQPMRTARAANMPARCNGRAAGPRGRRGVSRL